MRIPLTPHGIKELVTCGGALLLFTAVAWFYVHPAAAAIPAVLLIWVFSFFRDPSRAVPPDAGDLVSPADGTVADITEMEDAEFLGCPATRVGIFLSVFNVHINRAPCAGRVEDVHYRKGRFLDARNPKAGAENEALTISLVNAEHSLKAVVRQISGAIARRIVCTLKPGDTIARGQRYGMIKFGSRTELIIPSDRVDRILVGIGDKVHAGTTLLVRIKK
jgi:phosphatidylserine decarboxylase